MGYNFCEEKILAIKDILVSLTSYPEPSPVSVIDDAVSIAAVLGAHLAALSCETHVEVPGNFLLGSFANVPGQPRGDPRPAPYLGEHSAEVLGAVLGLDAVTIDKLIGTGLVATSDKDKP